MNDFMMAGISIIGEIPVTIIIGEIPVIESFHDQEPEFPVGGRVESLCARRMMEIIPEDIITELEVVLGAQDVSVPHLVNKRAVARKGRAERGDE